MIEITTIEETGFINASQRPHFEKITRLYFKLDITLEGIEAIALLQQLNAMQDEIKVLWNRFCFYKSLE